METANRCNVSSGAAARQSFNSEVVGVGLVFNPLAFVFQAVAHCKRHVW
jgi:hypothetical protein